MILQRKILLPGIVNVFVTVVVLFCFFVSFLFVSFLVFLGGLWRFAWVLFGVEDEGAVCDCVCLCEYGLFF